MRTIAYSLLTLCMLATAGLAFAENEGQDDLDKAMELKITAESMNDLGEVINLCRSSLAAGLDESNKEFASKMLLGTLVQRAEILCSKIFDDPEPPTQWPLMRQQAMLDLGEAAKLDAAQFDVHYMIGRLEALPGGDREAALKALDEAVKLSGESPRDQAKSLVLRANLTTDGDKRLADYDSAVKLVPEDAEIVRTRGMYLLMERKLGPALVDLDKAIELDPEDADTHEARGVVLFLDNKVDDALAAFDKTIELDPKSAMAHTHRARIHAIKKDNDKAFAELEVALKIDPKLVTALVLRSRLNQQLGKLEEALGDVNQALALAPADVQALQLRAMLRAGDGKFNDAIADLQQLRRAEPNNLELLMQLGMFYSADKQPRKAIETFTSILKKDAENVPALRSRGDAWLSLGKLPAAISDYESALKVEKEDSGVLNNLAWLLATAPDDKLRDGKRSLELAKEAVRVTEFKQPHILSTLAAAYAESGDFDSAKEWSQKAVDLCEKNEETADIREQLKKELTSYAEKKPWREKIVVEESNDPEPEELPEPPSKPSPDAAAGGK